jgi:phosphoribosylformimino-5-aminoimidazole carboxamide ribonucleotide (ProFAR) isomerase
VTTIDEIKILSEIGMDGVILGMALYTGAIKLSKALEYQ